jgi:hypothetical protein
LPVSVTAFIIIEIFVALLWSVFRWWSSLTV